MLRNLKKAKIQFEDEVSWVNINKFLPTQVPLWKFQGLFCSCSFIFIALGRTFLFEALGPPINIPSELSGGPFSQRILSVKEWKESPVNALSINAN